MTRIAPALATLAAAALLSGGCALRTAGPLADACGDALGATPFERPDAERIAEVRDSMGTVATGIRMYSPHSERVDMTRREQRRVARLMERRVTEAARAQRFRAAEAGKTVGVASLLVGLDAEGAVESVSLMRSSGDATFDRIAVNTIREVRYRPARLGGCSVPAWFEQPLSFHLRDAELAGSEVAGGMATPGGHR
jgi:TonB family protein